MPAKHPDKLVLFDGDCGVCTWFRDSMEKIDHKKIFTYQPYQAFPDADLAAMGVSEQECRRKVQVILNGRRRFSGAFAVNYLLWRHPRWRAAVVVVYAVPPLLLMELACYWLVSRNRRRISGWFGLKACGLRQMGANFEGPPAVNSGVVDKDSGLL